MNALYRQNTRLAQADTILTRIEMMDDGNTALAFRDLLFYPGGGGQPHETTGTVILRGQAFPVEDLIKSNGDVLVKLCCRVPFHTELRKGEAACQSLDVARRLTAACYHSRQHAYGAAARMVLPDYESRGMTIATDLMQCEMRFHAAALTAGMVEDIQALVVAAVADDLPITVLTYKSVDDARARYGAAFRLDPGLPPFKGRNLRTVVIGEAGHSFADASLCGGTHLESLGAGGQTEVMAYGANSADGDAFLTFRLLDRM